MTLEHINSWSRRAKCKNSPNDEMFFPNGTNGVAQGRRFCKDCPVLDLCKTYAIAHNAPGIWGGTSHAERERLNPFIKDVIRQLYIDANQLENWNLQPQEYQLDIAALMEEQPSEQSAPTAA
jgi:WhiB family redox-sensing transcriptional regulator